MAVPFYDLVEPASIDGLTCMVRVERLYCFDWDRFSADDVAALARSYAGLPGALPGRADDASPAWFGDDEDVPPFLKAWDESPGFQVYGVLPESDWLAWDARFRAATAALPGRSLR